MILDKCFRSCLMKWRIRFYDCMFYSSTFTKPNVIPMLCEYLDITPSQAEYMCIKHPVVNKLDECKLKNIINIIYHLGIDKGEIVQEPLILSILPITLQYRCKVLQECGFQKITLKHVNDYLHIVKQIPVRHLKNSGLLSETLNVENRLASFITNWPTSLTTLITEDANNSTLYEIRLKILQRYLELIIDITQDEFITGLQTYPNIKHRPLKTITETLTLLQSVIKIPSNKIKSNLYLVHADPDNLKQIIYNFRSIGGIDIKEALRINPKLCSKSYKNMVATRKMLQEYGISNEAQSKCIEIYTLGSETIKDRLEKCKSLPEFEILYQHPRFLKIIHHKNTVMKRMSSLYSKNKKCLTLNVLFGSKKQYKAFEKQPGDRSGKGKDLIFCLVQCFGKDYGINMLRRALQQHPFWVNIPMVQVKLIYQKLAVDFSSNDIYENCSILLYPWNKIEELLKYCKSDETGFLKNSKYDYIDRTKLSKSQILSLILYTLEKDHYFTGNGVWLDEKSKKDCNQLSK